MDIPLTYHTFLDYPSDTFISIGVIVPQAVYNATPYNRAHTPFRPLPPVFFYENGELGMSLRRTLSQEFSGLAHPDSIPTLSTTARRTTCRILWPGYEDWDKSFHISDGNWRPINRARLAFNIARTVEQFMNDVRGVQSTEARPDWWVSNIPFDELFLLQLRHVSLGSWQPVLRLSRGEIPAAD